MRRPAVGVGRLYYRYRRDLRAQLYIGAGQAAKHRKIEGKKEGQHAHQDKGKFWPGLSS